jgi:hypothetical protein
MSHITAIDNSPPTVAAAVKRPRPTAIGGSLSTQEASPNSEG